MRFTLSCAVAAVLAALGFFATSAGAPPSAAAAAQVEQPARPPLVRAAGDDGRVRSVRALS